MVLTGIKGLDWVNFLYIFILISKKEKQFKKKKKKSEHVKAPGFITEPC